MPSPLVALLMGSRSDWPYLEPGAKMLDSLGIPYDVRALSAHRSPRALVEYVEAAPGRGVEVFIAAAGGAAHLPGVVAAHTLLPVLGVPVETQAFGGLDSLLSIVQMPTGVPVGTLAVGKAGPVNAALFAAAILALKHPSVRTALEAYRARITQEALAHPDPRETP